MVLPHQTDPRILAGGAVGEDAAVVAFPDGKALVQTVDFFTPIVNDPYRFGQIAAANSLSDVYAMGGVPLSAMNIVCFPAKTMDISILQEILRGGYDKVLEAGAVLAGGHSVEDSEIKFGLSVSGVCERSEYATNAGLKPDDVLVLTKPIGTGVLATALKAKWENSPELEDVLYSVSARLNHGPAAVIRELGLKGATDVTGFGLGGHVLEMARASGVAVELDLNAIPMLPHAHELASMGLIPAGSYANKHFCDKRVSVADGLDTVLVDLVFDAQTSGGLVLSVPAEKVDSALSMLRGSGDTAAVVGSVAAADDAGGTLTIR